MILVWAAALIALWPPGILLRRLLRVPSHDLLDRTAIELTLGMAIWPVLYLWTTAAGLRLQPSVIVALPFAAAAFACLHWRGRVLHRPAPIDYRTVPRHLRRWQRTAIRIAPFLAAAIATRILHASGLVFPPWVDSVHHALITRLILDQGAVPETMSPVIDGPLFYHWGFHVLSAVTAQLARMTAPLEIPSLLLSLGQFLNTLTIVMTYPLAKRVTGSRRWAIVACVIATFANWFPGYFLSWGRYPHLTGMLMLPSVLSLLIEAMKRPRRATVTAAVIATAGLLLVHVRVAAFAAAAGILLVVWSLLRGRARQAAAGLAVAVLSLVVISPWVLRLSRAGEVREMADASRALAEEGHHRRVPQDALKAPGQAVLLSSGTAGIAGVIRWPEGTVLTAVASAVWLALAAYAAYHSRKRRLPVAGFAATIATVILVAGAIQLRIGAVDLARVVSAGALVISLYLPLAITTATLLMIVTRMIRHRRVTIFTPWILSVIIAAAGTWFTRDVLNRHTVIGTAEDRAALAWIEQNLPANAVFISDATPWLGNGWRGVDGGYWISVATTKRSLMLPSLYAWSLDEQRVREINDILSTFAAASRIDDALVRQLRAAGITHVYCGTKASRELREAAGRSSALKRIHPFVYELPR